MKRVDLKESLASGGWGIDSGGISTLAERDPLPGVGRLPSRESFARLKPGLERSPSSLLGIDQEEFDVSFQHLRDQGVPKEQPTGWHEGSDRRGWSQPIEDSDRHPPPPQPLHKK